MDFDTSFRRPLKIAIDYTTPWVMVDVSGGSAPLTGSTTSGPSTSSKSPQAEYSLLDVPISATKAVRFGCWSTSPIDKDALRISPNFVKFLESQFDCFYPPKEWPSEIPVADVNVSSGSSSPASSDRFLPVHVHGQTYSIGPHPEGKTEVYKGSDVKEPVKDDPSRECPPSVQFPPPGSLYVPGPDPDPDPDPMDRTRIDAVKENLKRYEIMFKSQYCYDTNTMDERTCITAHGHPFSWKEKSSGITWFGVHGLEEICVVTFSELLDRNRVRGVLASTSPKSVLSIFRRCVLSELEDLADRDSKRCQELDRNFAPPFCVVSATPGTAVTLDESGHETSIVGHVHKALPVLRSGLLRLGAIELSILGFQLLLGKKVEAKEIEVTVLYGPDIGTTGYRRDLDISAIADSLAAVETIRGCLNDHVY